MHPIQTDDMKKETSHEYMEVIGRVLKKAFEMLLKFCAFCLWVLLSGVNIILKTLEKNLKEWIFGKNEY